MTDLKEKLALHKEWLLDSTKGIRLDLSNANLSGTNLSNADLRGAHLSNADLRGTNLRYADLRGAHLSNVDLSNADLSDADLSGTNLSGTNLRGTNLRYADLSNADLSNADLSNADLRCCTGNNREVKSLQLGIYLVSYTKDILSIGCQSHKHSDWKNFYDDDILSMDAQKALDWWHLNRRIIFELIDRKD